MTNIAIIGASGAIGKAFAEKLLLDENNRLYLYSRTPLLFSDERISSYQLDLAKEKSIQQAVAQLHDIKFDKIIIATGLLHDAGTMPEKSYAQLNKADLEKLFLINTIGPALLLKHFLPMTKKNQPVCCAILSARVGSIGDNHLGGWYSYRMAKAALNMLIKTASIEFRRNNPEGIIIGLHPGTVESPLSQPFIHNITHTIFSPSQAVELMLNVLQKLTAEDSGYCFSYDGQLLPF